MSLVVNPRIQNVDADGNPYEFAKAYFWLTGTTTPVAIYSDVALENELTNPVISDDKGLFPAVFYGTSVILRLTIKNFDDSVIIQDTDPINAAFSVSAADLEDGAIEGKLGYTPVDPANAQFTKNARLTFDNPADQLFSDEMGYRGSPANIQDADYTLVLDDSGRMLVNDSTTAVAWTIPPNEDAAFPVGHHFYVSVRNTGVVTLTRGDSVTLLPAGSSADADLILPQHTFLFVKQVATNVWVADGIVAPAAQTINQSRSIALLDRGQLLVHNDGSNYAWTLDPHSVTAYPVGFYFDMISIGAGDVVVTRGAGVALRETGSSTNADKTILQWEMRRITCVASDVWMIVPNDAT